MTDEEIAEQYAVENWEHYEENQTDYKALKQAYLAGLKAGKDINVSTRWHYPSKGELPKCGEKQLIFYVNCYYEVGGKTITIKRTVLGYYQKSFLNDDVKVFVEKSKGYSDEHLPKYVVAWKEIVLPKMEED